jgi:hypothetical protein
MVSDLLVIVALFVIKQPAADDNPSVVAAAAKRVANNNLLASECCVNTATNTCHATDKCNKKEKECQKCNKKTSDVYAWMLSGGGVPRQTFLVEGDRPYHVWTATKKSFAFNIRKLPSLV